MKVEIEARVDEELQKQTARELGRLSELSILDAAGIEISRVEVGPWHEEDDDNGGAFITAELLIKVGTGVLTALSIKGILALVQLTIEKIVNKVRRSDKTVLTLKTPDGEYNLIKSSDRLRFKARVEREVAIDDRAELDRQFGEIASLIRRRFDQA